MTGLEQACDWHEIPAGASCCCCLAPPGAHIHSLSQCHNTQSLMCATRGGKDLSMVVVVLRAVFVPES